MMMQKVDVVIVNWNSGQQLDRCVQSLLEHGGGHIEKIVVIDNGSTDGSEEAVSQLEGAHLVRAGRNLGFAKACNVGVSQSAAEFVLLINPDARVFPGSISASVSFMTAPESSRVGIVGLQNIGDGGGVQRTCARFPTPWSFFADSVGLSTLIPRYARGHLMREWAHDEDRRVDHVIGAYFFVRRALWDRLTGMDERFFVYLEDLDFSRRAYEAGWTTWFLAHACVYHKGGGTSERIKATRLFYALRSKLLYAGKHFGAAGFLVAAAATLLLEPVARLAGALIGSRRGAIGDTVRAYGKLFAELPGILSAARSVR